MRETSLDDFIGGAYEDDDEVGEPEANDGIEEQGSDDSVARESSLDESDVGDPENPEVDESESESDPDPDPDSDPVEPAVSTYDWTPTGADCEVCGAAVEERWRDDGRLVCADCKAW